MTGVAAQNLDTTGSAGRGVRTKAVVPSKPLHQSQYDDNLASFFDRFNVVTGRTELYHGYITGCLQNGNGKQNGNSKEDQIAVDFGCGTGWLTPRLTHLGFTRVFGIDPSESMLKIAFRRTADELKTSGRVCYRNDIPESIKGKCSLVTAIHVHYHFEPFGELQTGFFGQISSLLNENGQAILVGCPSDYVADTPSHFKNSILLKDIPEEILHLSSSPEVLADEDGYIPLESLPRFNLVDGTQMKATFFAPGGRNNRLEQASVIDTFWSDAALIKAAEGAGLELVNHINIQSQNHPNAYMMMHFRKARAGASACALGQ